MRYWIALICAAVIIIGGFLFAWLTMRGADSRIRSTLRQQKESGELPPGLQDVNIEEADIREFAAKLPPDQEARLALARFFATFWHVLAPAVIALCLGVAAIIGVFPRRK
jgi:hypothetical protein